METLRALEEESLGFEDGLQASARDRGDDTSHHSAPVFSSLFFVFPCFSFYNVLDWFLGF